MFKEVRKEIDIKQDIPLSLSTAYESYIANSSHRPNLVRFLPDDVKTNLEILGFEITVQDKSSLIHLPNNLHAISKNYRTYIKGLLDNNHIEEDQVIHPVLFIREQNIYFDIYSGTKVDFTHRENDENILSHNDWQQLRARKFLPIEMRDVGLRDRNVYVLHDFIHFAVMMDPVIMQGFNNGYHEIQQFMPDAKVPFLLEDFAELRKQIIQFRNTPLTRFSNHLKNCMLYRIYLIEEELVVPDVTTCGAKEIISLAKQYGLNESDCSSSNYDTILQILKDLPEESWSNLLRELKKVLNDNPDIYCVAGAGALDRSDDYSCLLLSEVSCILSNKVKAIWLESAASIFANFLVGEDLNINLATIISEGLDPRMSNDCKTAQFFNRAYPKNSAIAKCFEGITRKQLSQIFK